MTAKRGVAWVILLALAGLWGYHARAQQRPVAKSEYRVLTVEGLSDAALTAALNRQATEGWELVETSSRRIDSGGTLAPILILKRSR